MKLIKAHIRNFRLLKDLILDFSNDEVKRLTVVRAANETGKTTCEYALMWALYGSRAVLPNKGDYVLFPSDLKSKGLKKIEVSVEVEFEVDQVLSVGRGAQNIERHTYRITRSCIERADIEGPGRRQAETFTMYRLTATGADPIPEGEAKHIVENSLPQSLKDVYFTDGDSTMTFIESAATQGVKRKRVSNAVEALLGLEVLNTTVRHLDNVATKFSAEIDNTDYARKLEALNDQIGGFTEDIEQWESESQKFEAALANGQKELKTIKNSIEDSLKLGDRSKLLEDIQSTERQRNLMKEICDTQLSALARLISGEGASKAYVAKSAQNAMRLLNGLNKDKKLPKANIPILEELLDRDSCFCGADLSQSTDEGKKRRSEIYDSIESSKSADAIQEVATGLFYRSRSIDFQSSSKSWIDEYGQASKSYQYALKSLSESEDKLKSLNEIVIHIDDSKLIELKDQEQQLNAKLLSTNTENSKRTAQIEEYTSRRKDAKLERTRIEKKCNKTSSGTGRLTLARHSQAIFVSIIEKLKHEELQRVSEEMNRIFLEMIGSDPESNDLTLITKAELTKDYDIRVYGPTGHELNPDQDLNGASRRAITLAFILALTKVSQVEAPNVIDTPLGMMAGFVKQSVLLQLIREGSQVILFLTHDEIMGVERIIDKYAGKVFTLTNQAHYPLMLKNPPVANDSMVIRCECSHRETCSICARKDAGI